MPKWEYMATHWSMLDVRPEDAALSKRLDETTTMGKLGDQGWELVTIFNPSPVTPTIAILKREKQ